MERVRIGVLGGVDVQPVAFAAAGGHDGERFTLGRCGDEGVGGVDGLALGSVGCGGVSELDC